MPETADGDESRSAPHNDCPCNDIVTYCMFCAVVSEKEVFYITKNKVIYCMFTHKHTHATHTRITDVARTIRKGQAAVWNRTSAGRANGDDNIRYSLCYNVILYLLNKTSN